MVNGEWVNSEKTKSIELWHIVDSNDVGQQKILQRSRLPRVNVNSGVLIFEGYNLALTKIFKN